MVQLLVWPDPSSDFLIQLGRKIGIYIKSERNEIDSGETEHDTIVFQYLNFWIDIESEGEQMSIFPMTNTKHLRFFTRVPGTIACHHSSVGTLFADYLSLLVRYFLCLCLFRSLLILYFTICAQCLFTRNSFAAQPMQNIKLIDTTFHWWFHFRPRWQRHFFSAQIFFRCVSFFHARSIDK